MLVLVCWLLGAVSLASVDVMPSVPADPSSTSVEAAPWVIGGIERSAEPITYVVDRAGRVLRGPTSGEPSEDSLLAQWRAVDTGSPLMVMVELDGPPGSNPASSSSEELDPSPTWLTSLQALRSQVPATSLAVRCRGGSEELAAWSATLADEVATLIIAPRSLVRWPAPSDAEIAEWARTALTDDLSLARGRPVLVRTLDGWRRLVQRRAEDLEGPTGRGAIEQATVIGLSAGPPPVLAPAASIAAGAAAGEVTSNAGATPVETTAEAAAIPSTLAVPATNASAAETGSSGKAFEIPAATEHLSGVGAGSSGSRSARPDSSGVAPRGEAAIRPTLPPLSTDVRPGTEAFDPWVDPSVVPIPNDPDGQDDPSGPVPPDVPVTPIDPGESGPNTPVAPWRPDYVDDGGWLDWREVVAPSSRLVYVAANGNDSAAASAKGRGYYLASDPEVGGDPTRPQGAVAAYRTYAAAHAMLRDREPDWLLFGRGDTFVVPSAGIAPRRGQSPEAPSVFAAYGPDSLPRPILVSEDGSARIRWATSDPEKRDLNAIFASLDMPFGAARLLLARHVVFEDMRISSIELIEGSGNILIRRSVVVDGFEVDKGHVQGLFVSKTEGIVVEECVFDRGGYKQDPTRPATWTAKVQSFNDPAKDALPPGVGVQPWRTWFNRNLYLSSYRGLFLRGNIISRGGSGSVQMRVGGVAERNVWIWNDQAIAPITQNGREYLHGLTVADNLVLHDDHLVSQALWGAGITVRAGSGDRAVMRGNILAHFHRGGGHVIGVGGISDYQTHPHEQGDGATISGNTVVMTQRTTGIIVRGTSGDWGKAGVRSCVFGGNDVAFLGNGVAVATTELDRPGSFHWGDSVSGANRWLLGQGTRFGALIPTKQLMPFARWRELGWDRLSTTHASVEELAAAAGWKLAPDAQGRRGWQRDIVSYMQSIDPQYQVDEQVTVDDGVPAPNRRVSAPRVWQVLAGQVGGVNNLPAMPEVEAKLAARRYHAFLTFIERARANRRGAWDPRYTADALNNYIRAGFGKAPVGGAYTARLPEESP